MPPVSHFDVMEGGLGRNPLHRVETRDEGVAVGRDALRLAFRRDRGVWLEIPSVALKRETEDWGGQRCPRLTVRRDGGRVGSKIPSITSKRETEGSGGPRRIDWRLCWILCWIVTHW